MTFKTNRDFIFDYMLKNDMDIEQFCAKSQITIKDFSDLMKNNYLIDSMVIPKVVIFLNIKFEYLFL